MVLRLNTALVASSILFSTTLPAADPPWSVKPLEADPQAVFAAADGLDLDDEDSGVVVLFEEIRYRYDAEGRQDRVRTLVYRMLTEAGVDGWDTVSSAWQPWNQRRPIMEARVLTPDGEIAILDPQTISEAPADSGGDDVFDDRRDLEAPLPLAQVGCIVEERVSVSETEARVMAGTTQTYFPTRQVPVYHARLVIEVDDALELKWKAFLLEDVEPEVEQTDGGTRYVFDFFRPEKDEDVEAWLPPDVPRFPSISFTTGSSWNAVASAYAEVVDAQIAAADDSAFPGADFPLPKNRHEIVQASLDWVHDLVRYTGLEFGRSSIVPYSPDVTVSRGYGDCKDQATLMVAVLRRWGIEAQVALLRAGYGYDTDSELPSLGAFNHVIVFIPGDPPLWADPTSDYHRAGTIPPSDSGRLALVADSSVSGLQQIPPIQSGESGEKEHRVFYLADEGSARLDVTIEPWGSAEADYRNWHTASSAEELRESADEWVKGQFLAEELGELEFSDPTNLGEAFTMHATAERARRGFTGFGDAVVVIRYEGLLEDIPRQLLEENDEEREGDFFFARPFQKIWHYVVIPPLGFVAADLPESRVTELGAVRVEEVFTLSDEGTIEALITIDSGSRRISAELFEETQTALLDFKKRDHTSLYFVHRGQSLLSQGKTAEALAELSRLARAEPEGALHQVRLAQGLIQVGLGEEARHAARKAVEIDSENLTARKTLGWVLQHDLVGRQFGPGFDLDGALEAYRGGKDLEDADLTLAINLAILLEHDQTGRRYSPEADLPGAIAEYQAAREAFPDDFKFDHHLLVALFWDRQFEEILEIFPDLGSSYNEKVIVLTALAAVEGVEEAHRRARLEFLEAEKVRKLLVEVSQLLAQQRFYPEAGEAVKLAAQGASNATELLTRAFLLGRTQKIENQQFDPATAEGVVKLLYAYSGEPDGDERIRLELLHGLVRENFDEDDLEVAGLNLGSAFSVASRQAGMSSKVLIDLSLAGVEWIIDGSESGVRRVHLRSMVDGDSDVIVFASLEDDAYKVVATSDDVSILGVLALELVNEGNEAGAQEVLDWARELVFTYDSGDPLDGDPFARIWQKRTESDADTIRSASLALAASGCSAPQVEQELKETLEAGRDDPWRSELLESLGSCYSSTENYEALVEVSTELQELHPDSWYPFGILVASLSELERYEEAIAIAEDRLERSPGEVVGLRMLSAVLQTQGEIESAVDLLEQVISSSDAISMDFNNCAWLSLFRETSDDQDFLWANSAVKRAAGPESTYAALHTLASLYAEKDMPAEAYQVIVEAMDQTEEPQTADWFVFGRMAETYGIEAAARAAYQRVIDETEDEHLVSTAALARDRLAIMDKQN